MEVPEVPIAEVDRRSRLITAAAPVLEAMMAELSDTRFSVLLADRNATIVDRRVGRHGLNRDLDRALAVPGVRYVEDVSGTNSLATAFELQQPIAVSGEEHFLEALRVFTCYGAPIRHPVTRRIEGVLDVTGPATEATTLLGPFLRRAVRDIELRLLEGSRIAERQLLTVFQEHAQTRRHAVLVLSESLVLSNPTATDLVRGSDHAALLSLTADLGPSAVVRRRMTLASGTDVIVEARAIKGTDGVLYDVVIARPLRTPSPPKPSPEQRAALAAIVGEPGTGRTTKGRIVAGEDAEYLDCDDAIDDESGWLRQVRVAVRESANAAVMVDNVHLLSERAMASLARFVRHATRPVVMTSSPTAPERFEHAALLSAASVRDDLRPLRVYGAEFGALVTAVLAELRPGHNLRLTPSAMRILAAQPWPGNLHELRSVLVGAVRGRSVGDITPEDLPVHMRTAPRRRLTVIETAERDVIMAALSANGGNKVAAAAALGMGRTTLYQRLRRYGSVG